MARRPERRSFDHGGDRRERRALELITRQRGDFARDAKYAEAITPIRRQIEIDYRIRQPKVITQSGTDGCIPGQFNDAVVIVPEAELIGGAQHAIRHDAADLRFLQLDAIRQLYTRRRKRAFHAFDDIRRSANDFEALAAVRHVTNT